jgi:GNAT superfamily N-acetyltransferase
MAELLRIARRADIAGIQRVRHAVRENKLTSSVVTDEDVRAHLEDWGRGWVIELDGAIRAFAIGNKANGNIWALFVEQGYECRGFGRRLHDVMLAWLWAEGVPHLWLTTGPGTRAESFYRAAGWCDAGRTERGEIRFQITAPA